MSHPTKNDWECELVRCKQETEILQIFSHYHKEPHEHNHECGLYGCKFCGFRIKKVCMTCAEIGKRTGLVCQECEDHSNWS
jgi:hypothetical protein